MRRLTFSLAVILTLSFAAFPSACKRRRHHPDGAVAQGSPDLASHLSFADPRAAVQLIHGFYDPEGNAWRWTARQFSAVLPTPDSSTTTQLVFKFNVPEVSIRKLGPLTLSASVNGFSLPTVTYSVPGDYTYRHDIPAAALTGEAVTVDFSLDKTLPPEGTDRRELGLVAMSLAFESPKNASALRNPAFLDVN